MHPIKQIVQRNKAGRPVGIYSCCSANAYVVKAVLRKARQTKTLCLIESTSNQVNQLGGYTGMTPQDFADFVANLAAEEGLDRSRYMLGGDHLGPLPWCDLPEAEAMPHAADLVRACVLAGYTKIHLDTSMRVGDDDPDAPLDVAVCARRGAQLCQAAEDAFAEYRAQHPDAEPPVYILGSEVPIPGGASDCEEMGVTAVEDCKQALAAYRKAFDDRGILDAFDRVVGFVVEMGVEFHERTLDEYDHDAAAELCDYMYGTNMAIEGHSTDYQTEKNLAQMCQDGCAILKVGPAFTFALREGLFSLEGIEQRVYAEEPEKRSYFRRTLEEAMLENPKHWEGYYRGSVNDQAISRAYSFFDRSRYYLPEPKVSEACETLLSNLSDGVIPLCMLSQYLPTQYYRIRAGQLANNAEDILLDRIGDRIDDYLYATRNNGEM